MLQTLFPTRENYDERKETILAEHLAAADLCQERREIEALPILRRCVNGMAGLIDERAMHREPPDGTIIWRMILALHSLAISALVAKKHDEATTAAATGLQLVCRHFPDATDQIEKLERLNEATGSGFAFVTVGGITWPYDD